MSTDPLSFASVQINDQSQPIRPFGSVWRRFVAYVVDSLLLSIVGTEIIRIIRAAFFNKLWELGPWDRLIGFFVASIYFASLDCRIGQGQTLGKRWLKLRVVAAAGNCISFWRSLTRFTIFAIPFFLYGLKLSETRTPWILSSLIFVVILWVGGSTWYLITFNEQARQGIHDLAVGSYVVYYDHSGPVNAKPMRRFHVPVLGTLLLIITVAAGTMVNWSEKLPTHLEFRRDALPIEAMEGVQQARFRDLLSHDTAGGAARKILYINIIRKSKPVSEEAFADNVARVALQEDRNILGYDQLNIRLFYGYDIGIATRWDHREFTHTIEEWRQRVAGNLPTHP